RIEETSMICIKSPIRSTPRKEASIRRAIDVWEAEGGAWPASPGVPAVCLIGTQNQVEWAERIRSRVNGEFDRIATSFRVIAYKQSAGKRGDIEAILAIIEEKRSEVMKREQAGYFIHDWQDISD